VSDIGEHKAGREYDPISNTDYIPMHTKINSIPVVISLTLLFTVLQHGLRSRSPKRAFGGVADPEDRATRGGGRRGSGMSSLIPVPI